MSTFNDLFASKQSRSAHSHTAPCVSSYEVLYLKEVSVLDQSLLYCIFYGKITIDTSYFQTKCPSLNNSPC